nr:hypothetical protein BaRGS_022722 [Batillaria attramentaria]
MARGGVTFPAPRCVYLYTSVERAGQEPVAKQILRRKWGWFGHTLGHEASIQHHTPSSDMEPAREKEERPASQQLEAGH